jgi:16S rRNA (uracil1498-N3)-methyltransferase
MTAPLFLLEPPALAHARSGARVVLTGAEGRHAATVRRVAVGEQVDVADGVGRVARCTASSVGKDSVTLDVDAVDDVPEPALLLTMVQALAKGGRDELAVESATEIGVDRVVPWQAGRSVVVWSGERGERSRQRWVSAARAASKQARRPRVPVVESLRTTRTLVERLDGAAAVLVLHEAADGPLTAVDLPADGEVVVIVGPEGGIEDRELAVLAAAGAVAVRLGPYVLRSSTAGAAALAVLSARTRRW